MEAKGVIMFDAMDGFRAEIMKQITPFFNITHGYYCRNRKDNGIG